MYNVNPDITVNNPQGGRWFMPGLLAKKYEDMGGEVLYFGKPHKVTPHYYIQQRLFFSENLDYRRRNGLECANRLPCKSGKALSVASAR